MEEFMRAALEEAKNGLKEGGIPIGSVLVRGNKIIGRGHNRRVQNNDPLAHAEIECIRNAGRIGSLYGHYPFQHSHAVLSLFRCDCAIWYRKSDSGRI